jgi:hypothetical protein
MSRRITVRNTPPRPTALIKLSCIEIDRNDSYDKLIVCASRFEESLKKTGAIPNEDYNIIDLFKLEIEATKVDNLDDVKIVIKGI